MHGYKHLIKMENSFHAVNRLCFSHITRISTVDKMILTGKFDWKCCQSGFDAL